MIVTCVVGSNKDIPKDPERSVRRRDVNAHEARETDGLAKLLDLHGVLLRLQGEVYTTDSEHNVW